MAYYYFPNNNAFNYLQLPCYHPGDYYVLAVWVILAPWIWGTMKITFSSFKERPSLEWNSIKYWSSKYLSSNILPPWIRTTSWLSWLFVIVQLLSCSHALVVLANTWRRQIFYRCCHHSPHLQSWNHLFGCDRTTSSGNIIAWRNMKDMRIYENVVKNGASYVQKYLQVFSSFRGWGNSK